MNTPPPDKHHLVFPRAWYRTPEELAYRRQHLLMPRMDYDIHHNGLHGQVGPPPKPTRDMMLGATAMIKALPPYTNHMEAIKRLTSFYDSLAASPATSDENVDLASRISENLFSQLHWIQLGYKLDNDEPDTVIPAPRIPLPMERDRTMEDFGGPAL